MSFALHYGATPATTISSSVNPAVNCVGASGVLVHVNSTSSLTITAQVALDGGASTPDYSTVPITNFKTGAVTAAGTAITVAADDLYFVPVGGASKLQIVRGAGSGTISLQPVFGVMGSNGPGTSQNLPTFTGAPATGELAGSATALQMPSVTCRMVKFKAAYDNAGRVYIGGSSVTVKDGTTDTTTGLELNAGDETPWFFVANLNQFYRICNNAGDDLTYIAMVS